MFTLQSLQRRLCAYFFANGFVILLALKEFRQVELASPQALLPKEVLWYISTVFRMYICVVFFEWIASKRKRIHQRDSVKEQGCTKTAVRAVCLVAVLDAVQITLFTRYLDFVDGKVPESPSEFALQYLTFIPKSLVLELIFDFCHY